MRIWPTGLGNGSRFAGIIGAAALAALSSGQQSVHPHGVRAEAVTLPTFSAQVVAHEVGQVAVDGSGNGQLFGYFPYIAGLPVAFFSGTPSEATAYFTFRSPTFTLQVITNGAVLHVFPVTPSGSSNVTYNVYYNANPNQSFSNPASFSQGQLIGSFNSLKWMATVTPNGGSVAGSFALQSSSDFTIQGQTYNLKNIGTQVTLVFTLGTPPAGGLSAVPFSIPFGGYGLQASSQSLPGPRAEP